MKHYILSITAVLFLTACGGNNHTSASQVLQVVKTLSSTHNFGKEPQIENALLLVEKYGLDKKRFEEVVQDVFALEGA